MELLNRLKILAIPAMLIAVEVGAVLLAAPMDASGYGVFEDASSYSNAIWFVGMLLAFTLLLLLLLRLKLHKVIFLLIQISLFFAFVYVFSGLFSLITITDVAVLTSLASALAAVILLWLYPEWYVIDILGVLLAAGIASMFGISLEPFPVIFLLIILAVYDAVAVYKTGHMLTLAQGMVEGRMPVLVVVPKKKGYSFIKDGLGDSITDRSLDPVPGERTERAAWMMGLGDLIMPAILVTSASVFMPHFLGPFSIPGLGAMIGSWVGLALLMKMVGSGRPQAGLPPLNGGAILGFLAGWLITLL